MIAPQTQPQVVVAAGVGALALTAVAVVVARSPAVAGLAALAALPQLLTVVAGVRAVRERGEDATAFLRWGVRLLPAAVAGVVVVWFALATVWVATV